MAGVSEVISILLVEDEDFDVRRVKNTLDYYADRLKIRSVVSNGKAAIDWLKDNSDGVDIVIMDYQISGGLRGEELISEIKRIDPLIQIIVITKMTINITDYNFANSLIKSGAYWYCTKYPGNIEDYIYQPTDFILSIFNAHERKKLEQYKTHSDKKLSQNVKNQLEAKKIIGESRAILQVRDAIDKYARSDANVIVSGPSGTGKELVAWNIHLKSNRRDENFVPINCGSIPDDLIESELFGYEKGAFTGAQSSKQGLFEIANNGTIFLDEVAELPLAAQVKLLRVLQEGEIEKIGRTKKQSVNVRIIAATNKDLAAEVNNNRFREDLYYRLNVIPIEIPPLKSRGDDIILLFEHFVRQFCNDMNSLIPEIDEMARDILRNYKWPGNVRELRNVAQRLVLNTSGYISAADVSDPMILRNNLVSREENTFDNLIGTQVLPFRDMERIFRKKYFSYVRSISSSDSRAAEKLGLAPSNFYRMCKELGLK